MVIRCSVSLVELDLWKFEAFRLIVTSAQVFHVFCDGWVRFWAKCPLHNLTACIHDLHFSFPKNCPFKIPDTILLGCPCIINVWLLTSGSGRCHVFINWHFLTESMVSCKELWRNKYFIENLYSFIFTKMAIQRFELLTQLKSALRLFSKWIKVP